MGDITQAIFTFDPSAPAPARDTCLYHYTNVDGYLGICSSKSLWLSDIRLLNDYLEVEHFFGHVPVMCRQIAELGVFLDLFEGYRFPPKAWAFVASLSDKRDQLSQWRAYSGNVGYALGFSRNHLDQLAKKSGFTFRPVNYDMDAMYTAIVSVLESAKIDPLFQDWFADKKDPHKRQFCQVAVAKRLFDESVFHKHPSFREEGEWRLFTQVIKLGDQIRYRSAKRGILPYVELRLQSEGDDGFGGTTGVVETILYPGGITNAQFDSACMLGNQHGVCGGFVRSSCPVVTS